MSGYGDDPRRNASGAWDPTTAAAIAAADRDARMPTRDEVRRAAGPELARMALAWGVRQGYGQVTSDDRTRELLLSELSRRRKARRDRKKGERMAQTTARGPREAARREAPDYSGALAAIAASLKEVAGKLDDLTIAVMDLKGAAPAAHETALPEVSEGQLAGYARGLDPLYLVGKGAGGAHAVFSGWCSEHGVRPCDKRALARAIVAAHPLHLNAAGIFVAGPDASAGKEGA